MSIKLRISRKKRKSLTIKFIVLQSCKIRCKKLCRKHDTNCIRRENRVDYVDNKFSNLSTQKVLKKVEKTLDMRSYPRYPQKKMWKRWITLG